MRSIVVTPDIRLVMDGSLIGTITFDLNVGIDDRGEVHVLSGSSSASAPFADGSTPRAQPGGQTSHAVHHHAGGRHIEHRAEEGATPQGHGHRARDEEGATPPSRPASGTTPKSGGGGTGSAHGGSTTRVGDSVYSIIDRAAGGDKKTADKMKAIFEGESEHKRGYDHASRGEDSWGPFQLNKRGGLGAQFQKETGKDPADPRTVEAQAKWVADYIKGGRGPISAWRGYRHGQERIARGQTHPDDTALGPRGSSNTPDGVPAAAGSSGAGAGSLPSVTGYHPDLAHTDSRLQDIMAAAAKHLPPGYSTQVTSGYGAHHGGRGSMHRQGKAMDVEIIGPNGEAIRNRGADTTGMYELLHRHAEGEARARIGRGLGHGINFGTSSKHPNEPDLMHFDLGKAGRGHMGPKIEPVPGVRYGETDEAKK